MIQEQLAHLPEFLPDYRPFPPVKEHTAWQGLPLRAKQRFLQAGEAALQTPIAPLPLSLWLDFTHTGRRTPWETAYFSRRARLCALVSAECVEHKGRFLDEIADTVWAICEESAWQLPAHNSYVRDTPQLPLPDTTRPIVDLFAAETGALLALTRYLLPDELDTAAPGITARMERELDARILTPYFTSHFWWMGNGEEPMCNWTSWCTQNVLLTVFLLPTTQQQRKAAVKQAAYSLDCFLKDYGADGCCNEGAQYYRHAGLTLWGCLEILSNVAPEAFRPLFRETKIKNIAEYICNAALIAAITIAVRPGKVDPKTLKTPVAFFFAAAAIYCVAAYVFGRFTRVMGIIMLAMFVAYMVVNVLQMKNTPAEAHEDAEEEMPLAKTLVLLVLGAVLIALGANLLVDNGTLIAQALGVPESVIALTFVALGTSLPELVTAITSLVKGHSDLSLGNVVGANVFNLVLVSGVSVTLAPFTVPQSATLFGINSSLVLELPVMLAVMLILTVPALCKGKLNRAQGILLLAIYAAFCAVQFTL